MTQIHLTRKQATDLGLPTTDRSILLYRFELMDAERPEAQIAMPITLLEQEAPCIDCVTLRDQLVRDQAELDELKLERDRLTARIAELEAAPAAETPTERKRGK